MKKELAFELARKVKAVLAEYPDLAYGIIIYDSENAAVGSNHCLRCIAAKFEAFLDENDIQHDAISDGIQGEVLDDEVTH